MTVPKNVLSKKIWSCVIRYDSTRSFGMWCDSLQPRKRADCRSQCFDVMMLPRRKKAITGEVVVNDTGSVWKACTLANGGIPPLSSACDNLPAQNVLNALHLGIVRPSSNAPLHSYPSKYLFCPEFVFLSCVIWCDMCGLVQKIKNMLLIGLMGTWNYLLLFAMIECLDALI